ncbi:MAG: peptide chain release factor aRF-1 [Thermoplasmata archaeon]|nr:peptide chain release factor aRF-1 [Thermoplasmata archaeon]
MSANGDKEITKKERYLFKKKLDELKRYRGRGTELISLYVPPNKQISDVANYLREEYSQSMNIKSKTTRKNVTSAIESILSRLRTMRRVPENGIVFFVGHVPKGADQTTMVVNILEPIRPISIFLYRCDSEFFLDPLYDMVREEKVYGLLTIDRSEATIGVLHGNRIEVVENIQSLVPRKHGRGGQSARRFERLIEQAAHEFFVKVGERASDTFLGLDNLEGIIVGGPGATKEYFVQKNYLHHELKKKIMGLVDTGYTDEYGLRELVEKAEELLKGAELLREKELMQRFLKEVKKEGRGLYVYGEKEVLKALEEGAVDILLVSDGLKLKIYEMRCKNCGETKKVKVKEGENPEMKCEKCGGPLEIVNSKDYVEELAEICDNYGTRLELISDNFQEGEVLLKAFGGIAGILRYRR